MKHFHPTTVNPNTMMKYAEHILTAVVAIGFSAALTCAITIEDMKATDAQHQMQSAKIDRLEAEVARLNRKMIDGYILVIDCEEQKTGRMK